MRFLIECETEFPLPYPLDLADIKIDIRGVWPWVEVTGIIRGAMREPPIKDHEEQ